MISNVKVYGLEDSIKGSKYPMSIDIDTLNCDITPTVKSLGNCPRGTGHDQFLTGVIVQFDWTLPIKAWVEAQRYHFLDFVSSQSTMHRISKFNIASQCNEYVDPIILNRLEDLVSEFIVNGTKENRLRILYNIPSGFRLTARMTTNYRQLKTMYFQRRSHALPDWQEFCDWCETLPQFKELCIAN